MSKSSEAIRSTFGARYLKVFSACHLWVYRATNGLLGSTVFDPPFVWRLLPMCLLTTTGRKTGLARTTPLLYLPDGERVVMVASYGGRDVHPFWYTNLLANPEAVVQTRGLIRKMRARTANPTEHAELWPRLLKVYPKYAKYQQSTERQIPVVICEPV